MKKVVFIAVLLLVASFVTAQDYNSFKTAISINNDGSIVVSHKIVADVSNRTSVTIPFNYKLTGVDLNIVDDKAVWLRSNLTEDGRSLTIFPNESTSNYSFSIVYVLHNACQHILRYSSSDFCYYQRTGEIAVIDFPDRSNIQLVKQGDPTLINEKKKVYESSLAGIIDIEYQTQLPSEYFVIGGLLIAILVMIILLTLTKKNAEIETAKSKELEKSRDDYKEKFEHSKNKYAYKIDAYFRDKLSANELEVWLEVLRTGLKRHCYPLAGSLWRLDQDKKDKTVRVRRIGGRTSQYNQIRRACENPDKTGLKLVYDEKKTLRNAWVEVTEYFRNTYNLNNPKTRASIIKKLEEELENRKDGAFI